MGGAGDRGQAGRVFQRRSVSATIAPGIAGSEGGHGQHRQAGADVFQHAVIEAEFAENIGRIILDHRMRCGNETLQQRHALGVREIERHVQLVAVHQLEPGDFFVFLFGDIGCAQIGAAPPIGVLAGLHLDNFGSEFAQMARGGRACPAHGQIDDSQSRQGPGGLGCLRRRFRQRRDGPNRVVLSGQRCGAARQRRG